MEWTCKDRDSGELTRTWINGIHGLHAAEGKKNAARGIEARASEERDSVEFILYTGRACCAFLGAAFNKDDIDETCMCRVETMFRGRDRGKTHNFASARSHEKRKVERAPQHQSLLMSGAAVCCCTLARRR